MLINLASSTILNLPLSISRSNSLRFNKLTSLLFLLVLLLFSSSNNTVMAANNNNDTTKTHYEILNLSPSATLQDVKKSYRKLALQHHPDRNPPEKKEQAEVLFRRVNEAYEVLSDADQRRQYDDELKHGKPSSHYRHGSMGSHSNAGAYGRRRYRDPFAQFNDLFHNDPFFQEAFKDMDDLFAKTFQQQQQQSRGATQQQPKKSWGRWIADAMGIDFQIQTSTTTIGRDGRPVTSSSQTSYGGGNRNNNRQQHSQYTSKSTRTVIENGKRVTIQSLEKDGNKIEEKYVNNELVQRLINGIPETQYRLDQGGDL